MTDSKTNEVLEAMALSECPPGPFMFNGSLGFKTEYGMTLPDENGADMPGSQVRWVVTRWPDAYCMGSGEVFWGGAKTHEERAALIVQPVDVTASEPLLAQARAQAVEDAAKVADGYSARKFAECRATEWDDDSSANIGWHARQIALAIRALAQPEGEGKA